MLADLAELLYRYHPGAYAHVGTGMAGQPRVTQAAQLLPGMWIWWVPESFPSVLFCLAQGTAGALLAVTAKKVPRQLRALRAPSSTLKKTESASFIEYDYPLEHEPSLA